MRHFPIFLDLKDRDVLVVGTAPAAAAKAQQLAHAGARVRRTGELDAIGDAVLVVCADADKKLGAAVAAAARARGVPVNVVDRPELCDFVWPAIVERGPVSIAISTAGTSPVLARQLRARIETLVPQAYGRLAAFAGDLRARVARAIPDPAARRQFWEAALDGKIGELVLAGREAAATEALDRALLGSAGTAGQVSLIGAGTGDPEMLTLKALRRLQEADAIVHDRHVDPRILGLARRDAARYVTDEADPLAELARSEKRVVRLTAGDAGPAAAALAAAGVAFEAVPGVAESVLESAPGNPGSPACPTPRTPTRTAMARPHARSTGSRRSSSRSRWRSGW